MKHSLKKLRSTCRIVYCLFMARTFGEYRHSGWTDGFSYALYTRRGQSWVIPTEPLDEEGYF